MIRKLHLPLLGYFAFLHLSSEIARTVCSHLLLNENLQNKINQIKDVVVNKDW